ncbi:hypothetical protein DL768_005198 [Monosporascus sp. mg162]|nr:hypothetical protein DL768_005198 [Monosporascus sp. mg162]
MVPEDKTEFFENGFQEFPRMLPENCVEYMLFMIDSRVESRKLLSDLEAVRKAAVQLCDRFTKDYIWQRDVFQLHIKNENGRVYLHGTTDYGDSVEDEWLIVFLLRELTKAFTNLWVRISDSDGEFLLVEAANVLPKWLSPEIDSHRAWIHQGRLWILPLAASSGEKRPLSLPEATDYLRAKPEGLINSTFVEAEAFYRLEKYPAQITDWIHHSLVTIPRKLAYILHERPATIAPAVEAFYLRDPVSMKPLVSLSGKTHFPPKDLVTVSVKFTKVLFAQVKSQRFQAPPSWSSIIDAAEKEAKTEDTTDGSLKRLARLETGMKITSGFEMLATNADKRDNRLAREFAILLEDVEEDGDQVLPTDADIAAWSDVNREDDESWLDINFEDFENELEGKRGPRRGPQSGFGDSTTQADLQKMVSRFEAFLNDETAGIDGAEIEDMDEDDDISDDDDDDSEDEDKEVSFDEQQFAEMMREMMGLPSEGEPTQGTKQVAKYVPPEEADEDEDEEIRNMAAQMEAELKEHGALKLDPGPGATKIKRVEGKQQAGDDGKGKEIQRPEQGEDGEEDSGGEEVDIDYNLAKNLLESFKSQAGMAGPTGNILGMMGMQLPRDEDEEEKNRAPMNLISKTYDEVYLKCSTAVYYESQGDEKEAMASWKSALDQIRQNPVNKRLPDHAPKSETERALLDSISQLEVQCKERIDLLEALRISREEGPSLRATPSAPGIEVAANGSSSPSSGNKPPERGWIGEGTIPAITASSADSPSFSNPPEPRYPSDSARSKSASQQTRWDSHSRRLVGSPDNGTIVSPRDSPDLECPSRTSGDYAVAGPSSLALGAASSAIGALSIQDRKESTSTLGPRDRGPSSKKSPAKANSGPSSGGDAGTSTPVPTARENPMRRKPVDNLAKFEPNSAKKRSTRERADWDPRPDPTSADDEPTNANPPQRRPKGKQRETPIVADAQSQSPVDSADDETKKGNEWEKRKKAILKNLPPGVDDAAAKAIFNEIVERGDEVHWSDIAGLEAAKNALKEAVVYPFLRPDLFMGLREPARGMLLFGPPGTGKTMLARAVATESKSTFFSISASSLTSKYLGESEKLVRALFALAKLMAPSIIFVDEIDSLLSQRSGSGEHEATRRIKTEFLIQWSDLQRAAAGRENTGGGPKDRGDPNRVLVLAATNLPWAIDEAARRRFVRRQYIPLPEPDTRASQLRTLLSQQKHSLTDTDIAELVELTEGFSGSDITALAKDAAMGPLRSLGEALLQMTMDDIRPMELGDFKISLRNIRPSVSKEGLLEYEKWARQFGERGG